jgi:hypothetical protein
MPAPSVLEASSEKPLPVLVWIHGKSRFNILSSLMLTRDRRISDRDIRKQRFRTMR